MEAVAPLAAPEVAAKSHQKIAWYLGAGLVGADIGTSVFYSTGVLYPYVGGLAPFFILLVCAALFLFKGTYQEGCAVNPLNGGAYSMVMQTLGRPQALVVGSLTILSYLATAVVSALSGALYLSKVPAFAFIAQSPWGVVAVAAIPVLFFAALNLVGLKESTRIVFGIAVFHFGMLLLMDVWGLWLAFTEGAHWSRLWTGLGTLTPMAVAVAFAAAFLGITGFESAAQIIEEIEHPNWVAIRKIYTLIVLAVAATSPLSSMLCIVLLSDADLHTFHDAFLSGLAFREGGTWFLYLLVANACLTLFAAVNTAFAGATGLMTTMGKQGNLPGLVLRQWGSLHPALRGFPYVVLPFMALCLLMLAAFPGSVDRLGEVYGMAFLSVMISYCLGVILLRLYQPAKVARAPEVSAWTVRLSGGRAVPIAPVAGMALLTVAAAILLLTAHEARALGLQLFLAVLLVMAFYRLNRLEHRMVQLPDLRLGLGRYRNVEPLPSLPVHVLCAARVADTVLVTEISHILKARGPNIEILIFHAEEQQQQEGTVSEGLERLISQQLEEFYEGRDMILSAKALPGNLVEVLPEYAKSRRIARVYVSTGHDEGASEALRLHLANEMDVEVDRLRDWMLPKGPGVWFEQWSQGARHRDRKWHPDDDGPAGPAFDDDQD
ncbi:MAG: APC family permease [Candidatus Sericytochromatia bacterium]|nr:APC family permease [Candidatus Sericytochromatia bacterium]